MDTTIIDNAAHVTATTLQSLPTSAPVRMVHPKNLSLGELKAHARTLVRKVREGDTSARRQLTTMLAGQTSRQTTIRDRDFNHFVIANVGSILPFGTFSKGDGAQAEKTLNGLIHKLNTLPRGDRSLRRYVAREEARAERLLKRGQTKFMVAT